MNIAAYSFLAELGRKISDVSGDDRESSYLFQQISVLIQRYNAILLHESFTDENRPDQWPLTVFFNHYFTSLGNNYRGLNNNNNNNNNNSSKHFNQAFTTVLLWLLTAEIDRKLKPRRSQQVTSPRIINSKHLSTS